MDEFLKFDKSFVFSPYNFSKVYFDYIILNSYIKAYYSLSSRIQITLITIHMIQIIV